MNKSATASPSWDERYAIEGFAFGDEPNDFLRSQEKLLRTLHGRALCLGEGEGRNAVWLARLGFEVTAVDLSSVGLGKAAAFAEQAGVGLATVQADLADYNPGESDWDLIISIWCHVPPAVRVPLHARVVRALRPGGLFVLTAYSPGQPARGTGGPRDPELCMSLESLKAELPGLEWLHGEERLRDVQEGRYHSGLSEVVEFVARKS